MKTFWIVQSYTTTRAYGNFETYTKTELLDEFSFKSKAKAEDYIFNELMPKTEYIDFDVVCLA
tara:strand:+ start:142 stop:330 length:189 start_codon:yes stop_codon:yes gene_type:complete